MKRCITSIAAATLTALCGSAQAGFIDAFVDTLPGGYTSNGDSFLANQWEGMKSIVKKGNTGLVMGLHTNHPSWDYENRDEENAYPYGGGIIRSVIDDQGNERTMFIMAFSDSHYSPEPIIGYSWMHRYNLTNDFHLGAGYILGLTFREDYNWMPIPTPLPIVGAGYRNVDVYMTFIPISNVFFFYSTIKTDDKESRMFPLEPSSPFYNKTELYAAGLWEKTDSATAKGFMVSSDAGTMLGARHFLNQTWAIDVNWTSSEHETNYNRVKDRDWKLSSYSVSAQYHMNLTSSVRMHAGAGIAYAKLKQEGGSASYSDVYPVVQTGFTWAPTANTRVMGGINVHFPRFGDVGNNDEVFMPSPVQFYLGAGVAF